MKQYKYTKEQTLIACDYGRKYYKSVYPNLTVDKYNSQSVDSIFHNECRRSLNINYYNEKYLFKDFAGQGYKGDVFSFVAYQHHLDVKRDFGKILQIINEAVEKMAPENDRRDLDHERYDSNRKEVSYHPDSICRTIFKQKFPGLFEDEGIFDIFKIRLIDTAGFYDADNEGQELQSNLETGEVYFSFSDDADDAELIYNPQNGEVVFVSSNLKTLETFVFGWRETEQYLTNDCPEVNKNLVITDSVVNVLLLRMMGTPVVGWFGRNNQKFLNGTLLERFENCLIFTDQTMMNKRKALAYTFDFIAEYIDFTNNPTLSGCKHLKDCLLDDTKEWALMDEIFGRFTFEDAA